MMKLKIVLIRFFYILIILSFALSACSSLPFGEPAPTPDLEALLSRSVELLLELQSLHFIMDISGRLTYLDYPPTLALKYVEGDILKPDLMQALVNISSFGTTTEVAIKEIEGRQYITNPLNQQWETVSPSDKWYFNPSYFFDSEQGLASLISTNTWNYLSAAELERKNQVCTYQVLDGSELYSISSGMIVSGEVRVEICISEKTNHLTYIRLTELESDPEDPTVWIIELSEQNQPKEIMEPVLH